MPFGRAAEDLALEEDLRRLANALRLLLRGRPHLQGGVVGGEEPHEVPGDEGAKAIADAVAASGALTHLDLRGNKIYNEGQRDVSMMTREGSWRDMPLEAVEQVLSSPFRYGRETLKSFEKRMSRARAIMGLRGAPYNDEAVRQAIDAARLADRYSVNDNPAARVDEEIGEALDADDDHIVVRFGANGAHAGGAWLEVLSNGTSAMHGCCWDATTTCDFGRDAS